MSWMWIVDENVQPSWAAALEERLNQRMDEIMALVQVEQTELDALDTALDEATKSIADKLKALMDAAPDVLPPAELAALKADVESLRALGAPTPAPEPKP